ncbi:hypothetical protein NTGM5_120054 [Candidatus Nitrotoga sp. M5]|nr:hypothetical protein NTGM5_120054 [Candidatus Nitrotoga sp. M5]
MHNAISGRAVHALDLIVKFCAIFADCLILTFNGPRPKTTLMFIKIYL